MTRPRGPLELIGLDRLLTDEEREVRAVTRRFVDDRVRPHVSGWWEAGTVPVRELAREAGALGLLGMQVHGYGCAGLGAVAYGLACAELEAGDSGVRSLVSVQGSLVMHALHAYGSDEQRERWLPALARGEVLGCFGLTEPDAGSDPGAMRTRAERDGTDWLLAGTKTWITNGTVADVAVVWARTAEGVRGFLVPTDAPGFTAREIPRKMSLRASVTAELALDGVRLPADALLPGARGLSGPLGCLVEARLGIVAGVTGAARDCMEAALAYTGQREQFGRPLAGFQLTQAKLADMTAALAGAVLLAVHLGRAKEAGELLPEQVSLGKLANVRAALKIARTARGLLGAAGITLDYPVMRHAANLETVLTYEGTHEVHQLVVGQALTGLSAFR